MGKEDKDLLLKDLCARLPYGVMIQYHTDYDWEPVKLHNISEYTFNDTYNLENCKPYLRSMSSMTEEEKEELAIIRSKDFQLVRQWIKNESIKETGVPCPVTCGEIDYCNKKHFDYRGLIEKNLALEVTEENNPYKE